MWMASCVEPMNQPPFRPVASCVVRRASCFMQGGYWLAEKTDGVRYLLFVLGASDTAGGGEGGALVCVLVV